ncbi:MULTISPECIES: DEAD/DEAH box helicase [Actinomadura]|uniref:DEAD/DEAH box helicase n=1 Tax=Actinomadura yumaensis TaxID=111807 RepID=A0ABW2CEY5_9ACTN|nr:DEAD/DEAH box helicase family protein [Actinomadura sp. J1-007]MWK34672.1 hypothetical protein [Actinomadura sp. J1-007]
MGELRFEPDLLDEIAHRLDLRKPNRRAIESVILRTSDHYDVQGKTEAYECIVDSATGVGKTFVMAGLMEYLAGAQAPARNFLLLAPGRTIRDKSVKNFTAGHPKSMRSLLRSSPYVVTAENFNAQATRIAMDDPSLTKLYIFTVQALTSSTGDGRATHEPLETLGKSFFDYLADLNDLVILADEHHCYRGKAFSRTIERLKPELVVGMTATPVPADESMVAFRYPLAAAIADKLVKTPVMVGRRDDRSDDETKLLDGVNLLRYKGQVTEAYSRENDLPTVNPVMLVVAKDIEEAERYQAILDSVGFDDGRWVGKTLLVHSKLVGDPKEAALAALDAVEDPDSSVRVIISVGMLKEGWDVKNVYVIASMRASVSSVMTEQTLGRGMRLPFGKYTGVEILDTLEILAHEKYSELLAKRKVLNEAFIDYSTYAELRRLPDGTEVVRQKEETTDGEVIAPPVPAGIRALSTALDGTAPPEKGFLLNERPNFPVGAPSEAARGVVDLETRTREAADAAGKTSSPVQYEPLPEREPILIPKLISEVESISVSLNDIHDYRPFDKLGNALTADISHELRRTKISASHDGQRAVVYTEEATDRISSALPLDIPLSESRSMLIRRVMSVKGVANRALELGAAGRIVDRVIDAMGDKAAEHLSAFGERCGQRLAAEVAKALGAMSRSAQVKYSDNVELLALNKPRQSDRAQAPGHADGSFDRKLAFGGWRKNLYTHSWFDSEPEFKVANSADAARDVVVWARLHINDVPITWTADGNKYNPDLVILEQIAGKRYGWLVEIKAAKDVNSEEVRRKRKAAKKWANTANSSPDIDVTWAYLLVGEQEIADAKGSWEHLRGFGQ